MMSEYKLIEWHHADFTSLGEKDFELFFETCEMVKEYPYAVVAFVTIPEGFEVNSKKKKASNQKRAQEETNFLVFNKSTDNQLFAWLKKHFEANGISVSLDVLKALLFRSGRSMDALEKEVKKISYMILQRGGNAATVNDVEEAASSTPECDTFAFSNAIGERNKELAYTALEEMKFRRVDPNIILAMTERTLTELLNVAMLIKDGDANKIESLLGMKGYKASVTLGGAKRYGAQRLSNALGELVRLDAASKFGGISGYKTIELFISEHI
jgi:DNA polymerase III delta subunit